MKTVDYYMNLNYSVVVDNFEEDGEKYVRLTIPILPGLEAYGESTEEAFSDLEGAKREWFSQSLDDGLDIAEPGLIEETSGRMTLRMPKSLHKSLTIRAEEEGISLNSYVVNLIQKKETFAETAGKLLSALSKIPGSRYQGHL